VKMGLQHSRIQTTLELIRVNNNPSSHKTEVRIRFNLSRQTTMQDPELSLTSVNGLWTLPLWHQLAGCSMSQRPRSGALSRRREGRCVDFAEEMVRATNEDAARLGLRVRVLLMDAEHLDFPNAAFDRVLCGFGIMFSESGARAPGVPASPTSGRPAGRVDVAHTSCQGA
jgi:hypothetical protein